MFRQCSIHSLNVCIPLLLIFKISYYPFSDEEMWLRAIFWSEKLCNWAVSQRWGRQSVLTLHYFGMKRGSYPSISINIIRVSAESSPDKRVAPVVNRLRFKSFTDANQALDQAWSRNTSKSRVLPICWSTENHSNCSGALAAYGADVWIHRDAHPPASGHHKHQKGERPSTQCRSDVLELANHTAGPPTTKDYEKTHWRRDRIHTKRHRPSRRNWMRKQEFFPIFSQTVKQKMKVKNYPATWRLVHAENVSCYCHYLHTSSRLLDYRRSAD